MKRSFIFAAFTMAVLFLSACHTTGNFRVPPGTELSVYRRPPITVPSSGIVKMKPFFWTAAGIPPGGGIPYSLQRNGRVIKEGRLRAKFRVASVFWPPFALIYWPMGMNPDITYDLINDTQR